MSVRIIDFRKLFLEKIPPAWKLVVEEMFDKTLKEVKEINIDDGDVRTEKCIICGKTAEIFTGHLHEFPTKNCDIDNAITAGFCSDECIKEANTHGDGVDGCPGCFGYYQNMYGKKKIDF